ncbi:cytochrome c oxidase subunit II [Luteimonas terrae]|uniref:Cytochrome c oxidase subunit II n=1 Tax=Luteimonas terrae TaxID=1530191 RepID=A0A4R5U661_9GAMM|nr:cytochrome c oxidase subunit II [Luteimonas terrae]TDK29554.1 cytochrome c oxidase subunit II [Luteimonas terrae]
MAARVDRVSAGLSTGGPRHVLCRAASIDTQFRIPRRASVLSVVALAGALLSACTGPQSALDPAGPAAAEIARGWWLMVSAFTAVWALVLVLLWRALARRDADARLRRPDRLILWGGVAFPTVVLAALLVYGSLTSARVTGVGVEPDAVVDVTARQWQWHFRYRDADGQVIGESVDELAVPLGAMVEYRITSEDVIHSFWIPRLGGKMDAIPGRVNTLRLRAEQRTPMRGQCAEFCGLQHARMLFPVIVMDAGAIAGWLADRPAAPADEPPGPGAPAGRAPPRHGASENVL